MNGTGVHIIRQDMHVRSSGVVSLCMVCLGGTQEVQCTLMCTLTEGLHD